jgi:hypothetical protein
MTSIDDLILRDDGDPYLYPSFDLTVFWSGPVFDHAQEIVDFYNRGLPTFRESVKFDRTETMRAAKPIKGDTLGLIPLWLTGTATRRDVYMLFLESGSRPDVPSDRAFALNASPTNGYVRVIFPTSFPLRDTAACLALCLSLASTVRFEFGQAGFALNWNHLGDYGTQVKEAMNGFGRRYPGLDMSHPFSTKYIAGKGIKGVNWLTLLSQPYIDRLGGVPAIRRAVGSGVTVHELPTGIAIQAGPAPEIGDVNRRNTLPLYQQVGRALASIRSTEHPPIFGPEGIQDEDATEEWLRRFDK